MSIKLTEKSEVYIKKALNNQLQYLLNCAEDKQKELSNLEIEIKELRSILSEIEDGNTSSYKNVEIEKGTNGYPFEASWSKKAAYVITQGGRPLSTREVANIISQDYEKELGRKNIVPKVSVALTTTKIFKKNERKSGETEFSLS